MTMNIQQWLQQATSVLQEISDTADIEARLCCQQVLGVELGFLYSRPDHVISTEQQQALDNILQRRLQQEPLAYILGSWCFWDLELDVDESTLIPRADTERLIEQILALELPQKAQVLDLGTGTGAIALTLAKQRPQWQLLAADYLAEAVALARRNAERLAINNCRVIQSDWFSEVPQQPFDLIVSNPPYIAADDPHLASLKFEPKSALIAEDNGLADIRHICQQAPAYLATNGWLWLEHGHDQAEAVKQILQDVGFTKVSSHKDYGDNWRISGGFWQH